MADITAKFGGLYEAVKDAFLEDIEELRLPKMAREWINRMCDYNIPGGTLQRARRLNACQGKMNRGLSVVETAVVVGGISLHEEAARDFIALGWCIEWLQASFLIADDIMDQSTTRRGQRCWYLNEGVGMVAINDCFMLQSMLVRTIKRHFGDTPAYLPLLELFLNTKMQTELGQLLDLLTAPACAPTRLEIFTMETYRKIVRYKTCYYSFYLPIVSCLIALGVHHEYPLDEVARILVDMGEFFQIQDDYLDCYGDPAVMGKVGTDIREGKCTWLIVQALASPALSTEMASELRANYGRGDDDAEAKVKEIYRRLEIAQQFRDLEEATERHLRADMDALGSRHPALAQVLKSFASRIFGRKK